MVIDCFYRIRFDFLHNLCLWIYCNGNMIISIFWCCIQLLYFAKLDTLLPILRYFFLFFIINSNCLTKKTALSHCFSFLSIFHVPSKLHTVKTNIIIQTYHCFGYALDLLVTVSSMCYHTSTSALSTSSSSRGLTNLTLWDISSWGGLHA